MTSRAPLTLLTRAYCSLCDEMQREAALVAQRAGLRLDVIDIDARDDLLPEWDTRVPVLFLGRPAPEHELCHYTLDPARVHEAIARRLGESVASTGQIG